MDSQQQRTRTTSNPALRALASRRLPVAGAGEPAMTINGTVNKTIAMIALVVIGAGWVWSRYAAATPLGASAAASAVSGYLWVGILGGLGLAFATIFKPTWAKYTAPVYAILEGFFVGAVSALFNSHYPGIVVQAVALTFAVALAMLVIYRTGLIKVTPAFQRGVMAATFGVLLFYGVTWILSFFHVDTSALFGHSGLSIGISLVIVAIAALNLVLDFHFIEQGSAQQLPQYMEWYGAFSLTVTLVWLYLEILRLLAASRQ